MDELKFRPLRADEIECRVQQITEKGAIVLLYKDARCDMRLLDETVGAMNWQRKHELVNGNLFCSVGIKNGGEWVWKQDVGTESNTEKEKGQASDAFKRACTNWGIGRELYTSPFIFIKKSDFATYNNKQGKDATNDKFRVSLINTEDGVIKLLEIVNTGQYGEDSNIVFRYPKLATGGTNQQRNAVVPETKITKKQQDVILNLTKNSDGTRNKEKVDAISDILKNHRYSKLAEVLASDYDTILKEVQNACELVNIENEAAGGLFNDWEANA